MRYRSIDIRIYSDKKFRALTPVLPSGQSLFLYLLTNPYTNSIPGLYRASEAAICDDLGWTKEAFTKALAEVLREGLAKADLISRVIFIPNAIKYNPPQSPNVVKSWSAYFDEIPECELKNEAYQRLKAFVKDKGEAFAKAFRKAFGKAIGNQEQEQEQEKEQEREHERKVHGKSKNSKTIKNLQSEKKRKSDARSKNSTRSKFTHSVFKKTSSDRSKSIISEALSKIAASNTSKAKEKTSP